MADNWQEYVKDPRTICKYGTKCYQRNPDHLRNFKHPPSLLNTEAKGNKKRFSPYSRNTRDQSPSPSIKNCDDKTNIQSDSSKTSTKTEESKDYQSADIQLPKDLIYFDKDADKSIFKELFLVDMPDDFFKFYEFLSSMGKSVEESLAGVNLEPIGPFDLLLGKLPKLDIKELYLVHWRFFYDPPEFQSVLKRKKSEYHIGYFRDSPDQKTALLASNDSAKGYHITLMSENIFGAVYLYLQDEAKKSPFTAIPCQKFMEKIKSYTQEHNITLEEYNMKKRLSHMVTKSFHGAGIVVPYNRQTQYGYRRLAETDANLKKAFANLQKATSQKEKDKILSDLQIVLTNASIAMDEFDFGTGLELGIDLFCSGLKELQAVALSNLRTAYNLLSRQPFAQIAEAHLKYRRKGPNMSLLNIAESKK